MFRKFVYIPLIVWAFACRGPTVTPHVDTAQKPMVEEHPAPPLSEPKELGNFFLTFYFVITEDEVGRSKARDKLALAGARPNVDGNGNNIELAAMTTERQVHLYEPHGCKEISQVSSEFAFQLTVQGSGKLRDGRLLSVSGPCGCGHSPCFNVTKNPWGTSGLSHPLQPFRTVAVDPKVVRLGSLLYIPALEGRTMPGRAPWGGYIHDGCVLADDTGGHIDGKRLDLFVGRKAYFQGLAKPGSSHAWAKHIAVYDGSSICERKGRRVGRKVGAI